MSRTVEGVARPVGWAKGGPRKRKGEDNRPAERECRGGVRAGGMEGAAAHPGGGTEERV